MTGKGSIALSYASPGFHQAGLILGIRNLELGFSRFSLFAYSDLDSEFCLRNSETLALHRGSGYWLWKPYVIQKVALENSRETLILYSDAGVLPRKSVQFFSKLASDSRIHVWETEGQRIKDWTDMDVLQKTKLNPDLYSRPLIMAGALVARNTDLLQNFLTEWLKLCENPELLRPDSLPNYSKSKQLIWHRHDQSLLSILVAMHPEWFVVHSKKLDSLSHRVIFDIHRNPKIKIAVFIFSFPSIRNFRSSFVAKLPKHLRYFLRSIIYRLQRKQISSEEIAAIKATLY